ncbi:hypothetical protein [Metabacillus sp. RGM 3146]|uniref:hypothetical protein n=1 Tax=Metabacillus sp. RGM 3146 TaxID=3401092 RepID=UPI003B9D5F49
MDKEVVHNILNQLKEKEINNYYVSKEEFLNFREVLVKRDDFKHFRGIGQRGGAVVYQYLDIPRS